MDWSSERSTFREAKRRQKSWVGLVSRGFEKLRGGNV